MISAGWVDCLRRHGLDTVEAVYQFDAGEVVAHSGSVEVRQAQLAEDSGRRTVFIKKYWVSKPSQLWSGMFRGTFFGRSKVRREHDNLAQLRAWELNAPAPVAYGEERWAGWLVRSFLMSEGIPNPLPLDGFIRDRLPVLPPEESRRARRELIEHLAHCTRRLHEHEFVHHDFFWRNILLSGGDLTRFFLIDAHKGRCWRPGHDRQGRATDLAALDAPAPHFLRQTERLRFFLLYRGHQRIDAEDRALLRLALQLAGPMREKQLRRALRRGRPGKSA